MAQGNDSHQRPFGNGAISRFAKGFASRHRRDAVHEMAADRGGAAFYDRLSALAARERLFPGAEQRMELLCAKLDRTGLDGGDQADAAGGGDHSAVERTLRPGFGLGDCEIRFPVQIAFEHADRLAIFRFAGGGWLDVRAALWLSR